MISSLQSTIERTILEYNKYRKPEAIAKIKQISPDKFKVEFSGPFCQSCGVYDYFEDFIYDLERVGNLTAKISKATQTEQDTYVIEFSEILPCERSIPNRN
ncbi:MAG: hypothetical protein V1857_03015 [archaeon]